MVLHHGAKTKEKNVWRSRLNGDNGARGPRDGVARASRRPLRSDSGDTSATQSTRPVLGAFWRTPVDRETIGSTTASFVPVPSTVRVRLGAARSPRNARNHDKKRGFAGVGWEIREAYPPKNEVKWGGQGDVTRSE
jgi:hypothetical protein